MAFYFTGDIHQDISINKLSFKNFPEGKSLTRDDYVIICGDFGLVWNGSESEKYWLTWLEDKPWTTLFVDGNHENFDLLDNYPVSYWNGGKVHFIRPHIIHLMRGQVFTINGKKLFTMGGASSHDKQYRKEHTSWWSQEIPNSQEFEDGFTNLQMNNNEVDYIISHCAPDQVQNYIADWYQHDILTNYLEIVRQTIKFQDWFFGHYHIDKGFSHFHALYDNIIKMDE